MHCMNFFCVYFHSAITKAVETAINSRQWAKAVQILELQDSALASRYYKKIADHYASIGEYEVKKKVSLQKCILEDILR